MVGSHVQRGTHSRQRANASSVSFSSQRAQSRAAGSQVHAVAPSSTSGESDAAYRQRIQRGYIDTVRRRSRMRRILTFIVAAVIVVAIAAVAGFLAFRGSVGSEMALKNSDATSALVAVKSDEPYYTLITAELGAVAEPLEQAGPDLVLLAYVDRAAQRLALVNIPSSLQVSVDNVQQRLGDVAGAGDAALIRAVQNFAKVDISHFVKLSKGDLPAMVDALGGIDVDIKNVVDDPQAGDVYLPSGTYTLNGAGALTYLRATNLPLGVEEQVKNQVQFCALLIAKVFSSEGAFAPRLESIDSYFQTDLSLSDFEGLANWLTGVSAQDITCTPLPGYMTSTAGVVDLGESRYVCSSEEIAKIIEALEGGQTPEANEADQVELVNPSSFTVEVQNGTEIAGAATATAETLSAGGFRVEKSGNAEQQVYTETLVVYKTNDKQGAKKEQVVVYEESEPEYNEDGELVEDDNYTVETVTVEPTAASAGGNANGVGYARAQTVINALGLGRAVEAGSYYTFDTDILVIIGSDYKPVA